MFSPGIERALAVSIAAHEGQWRKSATPVPYVVHPLHVALMLARFGQEEDVIIAGLLHDVVEDGPGWTLQHIESEFGHHVARLVAELTEDKSKSWEERKGAQIAHVPHMSPQAATVKAADKLHNLQNLASELRTHPSPDEVWARFRKGRERTLAMSRELVEALAARVEPKVAKSLRRALELVLDADRLAQERTTHASS
ncbi:MAG: bifunctional (p)ppGpp synthetase/guanosine-3',5'-bis(diphosphate) 3'-pyrophosphohydrolase [Planctomycetes bacterium]|nr:bifunctional (p)ppGpp synthetase/guanosine-3',5'-bis(diphosphate) 3'-pyrophosphohydrolase [Planctomycetota bacterium]